MIGTRITKRAGRVLVAVTRRLRWLHAKMRGKPIGHVFHVGKTGGLAVNQALSRYLDRGAYALFLHNHLMTLNCVPRGEKVIFFLRHPIDRFVSGFYSRQRQGRPRYSVPWTPGEADAFSHFKTPRALAGALSSDDPLVREQAARAMDQIQHIKDSYYHWFHSDEYFLNRLDDILFIGFQESLSADFERLRTLLGIPQVATLPDDDIAAHRNPPGLDRNLDACARRNLEAHYAQDIRFYEFCRNLAPRLPTAKPAPRI